MKELSIEEKAKRYDEALKVLHKYDGANIMFSQSLKEEMFPELAESEDERIRKDLIIYLRSILSNKKYGDKFIEGWIAWLEKQGKNTYNKELTELLHKVICRFINDPDIPYSDREKVSMKVLPYIERLEKQGGQKPVISDDALREGITHFGITQYQIDNWLKKYVDVEKQSKQNTQGKTALEAIKEEKVDNQNCVKPAERNENKVWTDNDYLKLKSIEYLLHELDNHNFDDWLDSLKDRVQPQTKYEWSEDDEKMLEASIGFIKSSPYPYSGDTFSGEIGKDETENWLKSLKDRVQPQSKQEWKQENTVNLTDFENAMMHIGNSFFGENAGLDPNNTTIIKEQANILLELIPKKGWSEEDEYYRNIILYILNNECVGKTDKENAINWFKSLKVRVQPQSDWGEEDNRKIDELIKLCNGRKKLCSPTVPAYKRMDELKEWLNFIRYLSQWKPSDEQITWLYRAADYASKDTRMKQMLNELLSDLKKLKE